MNNVYKTRSTLIFLLFCVLYGVIALNLYFIQIRRHDHFTHLGNKQYKVTATINPPRALVYDRTGKQLLAMNRESTAAFIIPHKLEPTPTLKTFLTRHFPQAWERLRKAHNSHFMYIGRRLTQEQIEIIKQYNSADIHLLNEQQRFYPVPCAGHIIGITDIDNKGLFGLELFYNKTLAGMATTYFLERDARSGNYYFKRQTKVAGHEGTVLHTTIDSDVQFLAYQELQKTVAKFQAKEGAVIVMDPTNGHIIAMAIAPDFDPNNTRHINLEHTKNRIITEEYELGSVMKVFATLAALEENVVQIDELIDCQNVKTAYIDGRKVNTVSSSVAGIITFSQVIEKSNNIGIAKVVKRLGTKLYDHYIRVGFGKKTGIQFPGERSGFVNPPPRWSKQSLVSLSYGYEITATLLQLATAFCMIAHDGYYIKPKLIIDGIPPEISKMALYSPRTIQTVQKILENTVLQGSAKRAQIQGYRVMCKTGTGNLLINGHYAPDHNIYTSAGIVQKGDYQRVIVTFIKDCPQKNMYASTVTAPLFERVAEKILIHEKVL